MADDTSERIFGLIAIAEDQQAAVRAGLEGLAQERAALAKDRVILVQTAEGMRKLADELTKRVLQAVPTIYQASNQGATEAVKTALAGVGAETTRLVSDAAQPMLERIADSVTSAGHAQQQLQEASSAFSRRWTMALVWGMVAVLAVVAMVSYVAVYMQRQELEEIQAQRVKVTAELAELQGQVDQARRNGGKRPVRP